MFQPDLKTLRLLADVCDTGSVTRAAELSHLEPSAVSKRLTQLEAMAGVALLERNRHGFSPTTAGRLLLEQARAVLFALNRMDRDLQEFKTGIKERIRLLAPTSAMASPLLHDIAGFLALASNQEVRVDLEEKSSSDTVQSICRDASAVGICWQGAAHDGLQTRPYRSDRLVLVVPHGHALARQRAIGFSETLAWAQVGLRPGTAIHAMLQKSAASVRKTVDYRLVVSNFDVVLRVVEAGLAIGVVPSQVVGSRGDIGVHCVELTDEWAFRRFSICVQEHSALSEIGQKLVDHLVNCAHATVPGL